MSLRHRIGPAAALAATLLLGGCGARFGMPEAGTEQAEATLDLWNVFMWIGIAVALIVYGLIAWSLIMHRRRKNDPEDAEGAPFRENLRIEIVYTAIPIVIVVVLFLLALRTERTVTAVAPDPDLIVRVQAYTWGWRFTYPNGAEVVSEPVGGDTEVKPGPTLVLPKDATTRIELTANDTIHAFWVPGFLFKRDAIPGRTTEFDVTPTTEATYRGACAELCGWNHAYMTFQVKVVSQAEFDAMFSHRPSPSPSLTPTPPSPLEAT